ncbi:MAG: hypothetical protein WBG70_16125 [Spirulinaceae cyanobacterium]
MINIKELSCIKNKYFYEEQLFTGVGFSTSGEKVNNFNKFENGINVGAYQCKYFPNKISIPHINIDYIDFTGEFLDAFALYKNKKFSGIAYELEDEEDVCLAKHLFKDGVPVGSISWHSSGEKKSLRLEREGIVQVFGWFPDGALKEMELYSQEQSERLINVSFDQPKQLRNVWIEESYFEWIPKYTAKLEFHYLETVDSFKDFTISPTFSLVGLGINDAVFCAIGSNKKFGNLSKITISRTSISEESFLKLANINTLNEVIIRDKNRHLTNIAKNLKSIRKDCLIKLNGQEIMVFYNALKE